MESETGTFVWNELTAPDPGKALAFYRTVLGWEFEPFELPDGPYWVAKTGDIYVGGIGGMETAADPGITVAAWFSFVRVADVDACMKNAVHCGATVLQPPHDVQGIGRVAVFRDPAGAVLGLIGTT